MSLSTPTKHDGRAVLFAVAELLVRDVADCESDGIRYFFKNPTSVGYLKSDRVGFEIFVAQCAGFWRNILHTFLRS